MSNLAAAGRRAGSDRNELPPKGPGFIRAISLWQPWASLWLSPLKVHETRHWRTDYRGPLVVHAAQRLVGDCGEELDEICIEEFGPLWRKELPRGALLGVVELVAVVSSNELGPALDPTHPNFICGNWAPDRWGWQRGEDFKLLAKPIPYPGRQAFFRVPGELLS